MGVSHIIPALEFRTIAGAAAGNHTVTGITPSDTLLAVIKTSSSPSANLASEYTITADNTVNNAGGTSTAGVACVLFIWAVAHTRGF